MATTLNAGMFSKHFKEDLQQFVGSDETFIFVNTVKESFSNGKAIGLTNIIFDFVLCRFEME